MKNHEIRQRAKERNVRLWQIAEGLGVTDSTFSRMLRKELSEESRQMALKLIDQLAGGEEDAG